MKKKIIKIGLSTFLMCFSALAVVTSIDRPEQNRGDLLVSTIDEFNETANAKKANIRRASSAGTLDCSKIYVQTASKDGYDYLRFATAVKGDLDSIVYSGEVQNKGVTLASKDVTTVYKSIDAAGESFYHNGKALYDVELRTTRDYYWACYTIRFNENSPYKNSGINVGINVNNGEYTYNRVVSLAEIQTGTREYTLGEYALDCQEESITPTFTYEKVLSAYTHNAATYEITQGGCTDGEYLYYTINAAGNNNTTKNSAGYVIKFDTETNKVIDATELVGESVGEHGKGLGNGNLFYNPLDGMIYSFGLSATNGYACDDFRINPSDMSVERIGNILEEEGFTFELPNVDTYFPNYAGQTLSFDAANMEYNASLQRWAVTYQVKDSSGTTIKDENGVANSYALFFYDKDLKLCENVKQNINIVKFTADATNNYTLQEMYSDSDYLYVDFTQYNGTLYSKIRMFDWDGNEVIEEGISINGGSKFSTPSKSNIQNVLFLNNNIYVATYQSSSGLHICKVSYTDPTLTETEQPDDTSKTFGELVEYSVLKNNSISLSSKQVGTANKVISVNKTITGYAPEGQTGVSFSSFFVAKGMTTDDEYLYVGLNAKTGSDKDTGFDVGILAKFDVDGTLVATSANSYWWGNGSRMSYYDGMILVSRNNGDAGKGSSYANTTKISGNILAFDAETLELISDNYVPEFDVPTGGTFDMMTQSPDGSKVAVVYNYIESEKTVRRLYSFNVLSDGTMTPIESCQGIDVTTRYNGTSTGGLMSIDSNEDYIYLFHSVTKGGVISVLDYEGNTIKENITISSAAEGTATTKNYQGLVEVNGKVYYAITSWGSYTGFGLYRIN